MTAYLLFFAAFFGAICVVDRVTNRLERRRK
jgi:hypothetical protein